MGGGKANNKALSRKSEKFYNLAKAHGFRSRAAFKLVQLNKKFNFLGSANRLLDLCAAPGGWMQVAQKYMPIQSLIVGVDLAPIKPIHGTISFVGDITTPETRKTILKHFNGGLADVVLHDGAPNMGTNWDYDAFIQNELTLRALKLATEVLRPGGTFVTKVFRSKDYNSLYFVMQKLFKRVTSTKPTASRNESAEIFVVCEGFLAPDKLDPRMLDPRFVFKEIDEGPATVNIKAFNAKKKARNNKEGYNSTSDVLLIQKGTVSSFLEAEDPVTFLYHLNALSWDDEAKAKYYDQCSQELRDYMDDLKLISAREAKELLRWRAKIVFAMRKDEREEERKERRNNGEKAVEIEELDEDEVMANMLTEKAKKERREQRKKRKVARKMTERITRGIIREDDEWDYEEDDALFDLREAKKAAFDPEQADPNVVEEDDDEEEEDDSFDRKIKELEFKEQVERYFDVAHEKSKRRKLRVKGKLIGVIEEDEDVGEDEVSKKLKGKKDLMADTWFQRDIFEEVDTGLRDDEKDLGGENDEDETNVGMLEEEQPVVDMDDDVEMEDAVREDPVEDESKRSERLELLRMGRKLIKGEATIAEMTDMSFNRWARKSDDDEGLPDWFVEKETYWGPYQAPVDRDAQEDIDRIKGIADKPLKKVAEYKARQKRKATNKLKKVQPKVEAIAANSEMAPSERVKAIAKLYRGLKPKERQKVYVIGKRKDQMEKKRVVKGKRSGAVKMVDARMKRDKKKATKKKLGTRRSGPKRKRG